jgi:hypothetical protein
MVERRCRYCERIFQPSKYQPGQSVCSDPGCQRRRRTEYHRQKIAADPEYRQVCLDSPQKWRSRNPDYWRRYREQHPAAVERNRQQPVVLAANRERMRGAVDSQRDTIELYKVDACWFTEDGAEIEIEALIPVAGTDVSLFCAAVYSRTIAAGC